MKKYKSLEERVLCNQCINCKQFFNKDDINNKNYIFSKTKRKTEIFMHKTCLK